MSVLNLYVDLRPFKGKWQSGQKIKIENKKLAINNEELPILSYVTNDQIKENCRKKYVMLPKPNRMDIIVEHREHDEPIGYSISFKNERDYIIAKNAISAQLVPPSENPEMDCARNQSDSVLGVVEPQSGGVKRKTKKMRKSKRKTKRRKIRRRTSKK